MEEDKVKEANKRMEEREEADCNEAEKTSRNVEKEGGSKDKGQESTAREDD